MSKEPMVTDWISCRTPPPKDRPGLYEVAMPIAGVMRVFLIRWSGKDWAYRRTYPVLSHYDRWRGLTAPAEG